MQMYFVMYFVLYFVERKVTSCYIHKRHLRRHRDERLGHLVDTCALDKNSGAKTSKAKEWERTNAHGFDVFKPGVMLVAFNWWPYICYLAKFFILSICSGISALC